MSKIQSQQANVSLVRSEISQILQQREAQITRQVEENQQQVQQSLSKNYELETEKRSQQDQIISQEQRLSELVE